MKVLLVYPNLPLMLVPPLSIAIFTNKLKSNGYQVDLFDTTSYTSEEISSPQNRVKFLQAREFNNKDLGVITRVNLLEDFKEKIKIYKPDCMIFSVVEDSFLKTVNMIEEVQHLKIPTIIGGVFPTAAPEICLQYSCINLVGLGEGEETILNFAEAVKYKKPLNNLPGTWYKTENGEIRKNEANPLINIDDNSPDFSLFEISRFYRPMGGKIFKTIPICKR